VVVSTASSLGDMATEIYRELFEGLGVSKVTGIRPDDRDQADDPEVAAPLTTASGVFLTGGNQLRLSSAVGGTRLASAVFLGPGRGAVSAGTPGRERAGLSHDGLRDAGAHAEEPDGSTLGWPGTSGWHRDRPALRAARPDRAPPLRALAFPLPPGAGSGGGHGGHRVRRQGHGGRWPRRREHRRRLPRPHRRVPGEGTPSPHGLRGGSALAARGVLVRPAVPKAAPGRRSGRGTGGVGVSAARPRPRADRERAKREPAAEKPPAKADLKIVETQVFRGPNYWSYEPCIRLLVDLGSLEEWPSNTLPGFTEGLLEMLPGVGEHSCSLGRRGGFRERLEEGTWVGP